MVKKLHINISVMKDISHNLWIMCMKDFIYCLSHDYHLDINNYCHLLTTYCMSSGDCVDLLIRTVMFHHGY